MNDSELAKQIGKAARAARDALGLSQADVAERVEISTEFYGRLERGVTLPSVPTLAKVAAVLAVTADTLMGTGARQKPGRRAGAEAPVSQTRRLLERRLRRAPESALRVANLVLAALEAAAGTSRRNLARPKRRPRTARH